MLRLLLISIIGTIVLSCENTKASTNNIESRNCKELCNGETLLKLKTQENGGFSYLAFPNFGHFGIGRCRGHALLTQKMSILANFKHGSRCDLTQLTCQQEIKDGITKITNFQSHTFTGYRNLREFSATPEIQQYLRRIVAGTSHRFRAGAAKLSNLNSLPLEINTYKEIQNRLDQGHLPYVGLRGQLVGSHAVLIYGQSVVDNKNVLCARDPNFIGEKSENCENYFYLTSENQVFYKQENKDADLMQTFKLTSDEDMRVTKYQSSLEQQCLAEVKKSFNCI